MSKRLAFLEKATRDGSADPFVWYGLALEYRSAQRHDEALQTFATLRTNFTSYVPTYLMCAQLLIELNRKDEARDWLAAGIFEAKKVGNAHALSEMTDALEGL
jgi:tetratricopeptide (TPR) repeat protein